MPMWPTLIELAVTPVSVAPPTAPPGAGAPGVAPWPGVGVGALLAACDGVRAAPVDCLAAGLEAAPVEPPAAPGVEETPADDLPPGVEAAPGVADSVGAAAVSVPAD